MKRVENFKESVLDRKTNFNEPVDQYATHLGCHFRLSFCIIF